MPMDYSIYFDRSSTVFPLLTGFVFLIGSCIGSFLNVVIWRLPREESIVTAPSHCPACNEEIRWYDNVPLLGWLWLRGKCRFCQVGISARYPLVEGMTGLLFLFLWLLATRPQRPLAPSAMVAYMILCALLVAITFIDFDHMIIPDALTLPGVLAALAFAIAFPASHDFHGAPGVLEMLNHKPMAKFFVEPIARFFPGILDSARMISFVDLLTGAALGGGFLWLVAEGGKLLLGKRRVKTDEPVVMTLTAEGFRTDEDEEDELTPWEDIFMRDSDRMVIEGTLLELATTADEEDAAPPDEAPTTVELSEETLCAGDREIAMATLTTARVRTSEWIEPREAMGLGDAKLMALMGAFLGPGACIFILCASSLFGAAVGLLSILFGGGKLYSKLPFGPYLALGGVVYIFFGNSIILFYARTMLRLTKHLVDGNPG